MTRGRAVRASTSGASGRFLLRLEPGLHAALRATAKAAGTSLNELCARRLAAPAAGVTAEVLGLHEAVIRATATFGEGLVGVVLFGSVARGEAGADSDLDLLVVLEPRIPLTRELYRRWDDRPLPPAERPLQVHFAHLPDPERGLTGFWAEIAIDGIVVHERGIELSRRLVAVRRALIASQLERRSVHGQSYWVESA